MATDQAFDLRHQLKQLETSLAHLERSNAELEEALKESPGDRDFRDAIDENKVVIAKRKAQIVERRALLTELEGAIGQGEQAPQAVQQDAAGAAQGDASRTGGHSESPEPDGDGGMVV